MPACVFPGAPPDLSFPRKCSTHFVLNIHKLLFLLDPAAHGLGAAATGGRVAPPVQLRAHSFLEDPRTHADIKASVAHVELHGPRHSAQPGVAAACSAPHDRTCSPALAREPPAHSSGGAERAAGHAQPGGGGAATAAALRLRRGASDEEVRLALDGPDTRRVRTLHLSDAEGAFAGWVGPASASSQGELFALMERYFLLGGDWCCTSRRANEGRLYPVDPPRLSTRLALAR